MNADDVIAALDLSPHPEGGHFRETFRDGRACRPAGADRDDPATRSYSTAIYYLLKSGEVSHWHRVDATEVWHWYAGAPLELAIADRTSAPDRLVHRLGTKLADGERPQVVVPAGAWQSACSLGAWTLVGCTVAPGFEFAGFELAPPDWRPDQ